MMYAKRAPAAAGRATAARRAAAVVAPLRLRARRPVAAAAAAASPAEAAAAAAAPATPHQQMPDLPGIASSVTDLVGNTPLVRLNRLAAVEGVNKSTTVLAKVRAMGKKGSARARRESSSSSSSSSSPPPRAVQDARASKCT
jgi:hypothetical protein